jgi:N-acetylmuramoyl-L-alanine amidase
MFKRCLTLIALSLVAARVSAAAPPVRTMYDDALAKEQAVRKALADPQMSDVVLKAVREVVSSYEAVVRHYPASAYCDDALWNAGRLELDAFARFHRPEEKDAAASLFAQLKAGYPSSKFVRQIPAGLGRATARAAAAAARTAPSEPEPAADGPAERSVSLATIKDVRRVVLPDTVRVTIELDGEVPFHDERIADPDRLFVDLPATRPAQPLADRTIRFDGDSDIVRQVRIGRHPNHVTRVVLDASGVSSYSVYPLYSPFRLVIDCTRAPSLRRAAAVAAPAPLSARSVRSDLKRAPMARPMASLAIAEARFEMVPPISEPDSTALPSARTSKPDVVQPASDRALPPPATAGSTSPAIPQAMPLAGVSIARQLGLGVSRIVIDAGHGGHDPGAKGKGVTEAELVLDVALRLEKLLAAVPGVDVILTRRSDEFIPLQERTAIANREGADLFLSIHANASPNAQARGVETYFLNFANNLSAAAVAARENAASGQAMAALPDFVKQIALNNKLDESRDFASQVQHAMTEKLRESNKTLKDLGVKQAPFVVLIGAAMPSVLAEISFVTNPQEARLLKSNAYRQKIAEALFKAIQKYQVSLKRVQTAAQH